MTDEKYQEIKAKIQERFDWWSRQVGLLYWHIKVQYYDGPIPDAEPEYREQVVAARCEAMWEYQEVTFRFSCWAMEDNSDDEIEKIVVHEICHALVCEMQHEKEQHHVERVVSGLQQAFMWVRDKALEEKC